MEQKEVRVSSSRKVFTALFYAGCSFFIVIVNKVVLTTYKFPSFQAVAIGQMVATILILGALRMFSFVNIPMMDRTTFPKIWPLPVIYLLNLVTGLGSTKSLSLPMFTVLRRFSILMTMIAEYFLLKVIPSKKVQISVYMMIGGALVAASFDLAFEVTAYTLVLVNDVMTAANGVYTKKKLGKGEMNKYSLLFYNALFMLIPVLLFATYTGDLKKAYEYDRWTDLGFIVQLSLSSCMGLILNYSILLCTQVNSALTTTIIGCLKNVIVTYIGMLVGGDYLFSWTNFIGVNISIFGSIIYSYITFYEKKPAPKQDSELKTVKPV